MKAIIAEIEQELAKIKEGLQPEIAKRKGRRTSLGKELRAR
jgi:hypothetical protein